MKTKQPRTAHHCPDGRRAVRRGAEPPRFAEPARAAGLTENCHPATESYDVKVRFRFVATRQSADPAQLPWLEEMSDSQHVNGTFSGIIQATKPNRPALTTRRAAPGAPAR
ncbi:hypothetical protein [Paeniglutamicibacter sp.]|uniref:hypothetical protein n=1 Tax=Paeniglutamicibacter sp. TaxID=1934391 RepID=UPI0039897ECE